MKKCTWPLAATIFMGVLQVVSCTKTNDIANDSLSLETSNDLVSNPKKCSIVSFTQDDVPLGPGTRTVNFYYNSHGDIDSMIADVQTGSLGLERFYFTYGKNHKLIAYREDAGDTYFYVVKHTYAYEHGRIVRDSMRISDATFTEVTTLEYDSEGRVIKETRKIINDDGTVDENLSPIIYTYDEQGNLADVAASYDKKVNFLRTSEQLMFTQRDYSTNNRAPATAYNQYGLPLGFAEDATAPPRYSSLFSFGLPISIEYDCKK